MIFTSRIQKAIKFSIKTHEIYQQQKRKGKNIPYIVHPISVALILARASASEDVVIAGLLHDTIEDSITEKKVTREMINDRFGEYVTKLVESVTEKDKSLSWEIRKQQAIDHVDHFSYDSLLLKSADVINNDTELLVDYEKEGDSIFERFNAPKEKFLKYKLNLIEKILSKWFENPLREDLKEIYTRLKQIM